MADLSRQSPESSGRKLIERGIRRLPNGSYEVRVHVPGHPGMPRREVSRIVREGIRAARSKRAHLEVEVKQGLHGGSRATFGYLLDAWNTQRADEGASPTTLHEDRRKIDQVIRPALGEKRLDKLSTLDLDRFYAGLLAKGVSLGTVKHHHAIIRSALNVGVDWGWLASNPAMRARVAKQRGAKPDLPVPSQEEVVRLIRTAQPKNPTLAAVIVVAAATGLREGELCALRFSDVDLEGGCLTVRASVWVRGSEIGLKDPKSHQRRTIAIDPAIAGIIRQRWDLLGQLGELVGFPLTDGFVFSKDGLGTDPLSPRAVSGAFGRLAKTARVRCRFHDLRRFMVTELFAAGVDPKTIAVRAGHADPAFTARVYAAGRAQRDEDAAELLGQILSSLDPRYERVPASDSPDWYGQRAALWELQQGRCGVCKDRLELETCVVDHDHETGLTRGLLCRGCNGTEPASSHPHFVRYRESPPAKELNWVYENGWGYRPRLITVDEESARQAAASRALMPAESTTKAPGPKPGR